MFGLTEPGYGNQVSTGQSISLGKPTITEALLERKKFYEEGLERTNKALDALKNNPGIEEVINLLQKAAY